MSNSVTVAVRLPREVRQLLEEKVSIGDFSSLTDLLRNVLTHFAESGEIRKSEGAEACKQQEVNSLGDNGCPILTFARSKLCNACPYREQPVTTRVEGVDELLGNLRSMNERT
jgi:Arc/MetJ-type ribon-helix-helix transcriptional regulator